jgi:hypothetical protein
MNAKKAQFDDVRMAESAHVFKLAFDPGFGLFSLYHSF